MRGDEDAPPASACVEQPRGERRLAIGVDPARRLVEHEQIRLRDRDGRDAEPLALAAREIAGMTVTSRTSRPNALERRCRALLVPADAERDLVDRGLADEVPAGILGEVGRPSVARRPCPASARAGRRRSSPASSCRCRWRLRARRSRRDGRRATAAENVRAVAVGEADAVEPDERLPRLPRPGPDRARSSRPRSGAVRTPSHARASATGASRTTRPSSIMITRSAIASARSTRCSREDDGAARLLDRSQERRGAGGVELGRRLVEEQELRLRARARRRGRRAAAHRPRARPSALPRDAPAPTSASAASTRGQISSGRDSEVLEAERDLVLDPRHHDLVLGILEHRGHGAGELGGAVRAGVEARRPRRDPRSARRGSAARARRAPGAASTCRCRTARAARRSRPPGARARRPARPERRPG